MLNVDLHLHTRYSPDAVIPPDELVERAVEVGLDRVAVTDHGEVDGALEARARHRERVIVGEEVRCACRTEVIGLFLSRRIPDGLPLEETVERIRDQGGVVYVPHPYAYAWRAGARAHRALPRADVVEVANARAFLPWWNRRARRAARELGLPGCAGSDAHFPREMGRAFTRMPAFDGPDAFRRAVRRAEPVLRRITGPTGHLESMLHKGARLAADAIIPDGGGADRRRALPLPGRGGSARRQEA